MSKLSWDIAGKTDPGCVRENNEDSLAVDLRLGLLVVADGMGGHNAGEVASRMATETILDYARKMIGGDKQMIPEGGDASKSVKARQLEYFVQTANTLIFEKARVIPQDHGMGTTVVAVLADDGAATVAHVGDSRLYLFRRGALEALTEDHSLVADQVRRGLITAEQAEKSSMQNILTRALGTEPNVVVDLQDYPVLPGDVLLLCTDGLTKMVSEAEIAKTLSSSPTALSACDSLIAAARAAGGVDNITVVAAFSAKKPGMKGLLGKIFGT
ncbi:MAG: Stp1/IreP family PP2C-type Ser/Thr phosphatase [Elusimicrobia bacterium]|nr:Stp1/IreP family PP2C-type Ser/Thr phosphatase [Elusimicrobiota bacterium]